MSTALDGFYAVYLSGASLQGLALLVLRNGQVAGADAAGAVYRGAYTLDDSSNWSLTVNVNLPANIERVQGGTTGPKGDIFEVKTLLEPDFLSRDYIRIQTPRGPVNAKFVKLNSIDV
jgi:hypothetical protein